ncbi:MULTISPECIES: hypothetical protein [unclassified Streptococcus]|uniref:hypothetical protein n=1 Tax=unclassified Streptococcus TaxID=2608887 RepID=UPI001364BC12|nr:MULTISPECIES: hypothetical protein [unclassified Streptococcus]
MTIYKPSLPMSINDKKIVHVHSRSEAEVAVYKSLPYKASFALSIGHSFSMDMRLLGLSYFSKTELQSLDKISNTNLWDKFLPFFETKQNQLLSIIYLFETVILVAIFRKIDSKFSRFIETRT